MSTPLTPAQQDLGLMDNTVFTPFPNLKDKFPTRSSLDSDSLWKTRPRNGKYHFVYADKWSDQSLLNTRSKASWKPSLIAPEWGNYVVKNSSGTVMRTWGRPTNKSGGTAQYYIQVKCRGNASCDYWQNTSFTPFFKDNGRLCFPVGGSRERSSVGNCGVGVHRIDVGYGNAGLGMQAIQWLGAADFQMLPQNRIVSIPDLNNCEKCKPQFSFDLAPDVAGGSATLVRWLAPVRPTAAPFDQIIINPNGAVSHKYYNPARTKWVIGVGSVMVPQSSYGWGFSRIEGQTNNVSEHFMSSSFRGLFDAFVIDSRPFSPIRPEVVKVWINKNKDYDTNARQIASSFGPYIPVNIVGEYRDSTTFPCVKCKPPTGYGESGTFYHYQTIWLKII